MSVLQSKYGGLEESKERVGNRRGYLAVFNWWRDLCRLFEAQTRRDERC